MDTLTNKLARFATGVASDAFPERTIHALKRHIIDSIGCALGAMHEPAVQIASRLAEASGATPVSGFFGSDARSSPEHAAFVNGLMIRSLDFNDTYPGGHPSDGLGAVFALAQANGATGARTLQSAFILYEVFGALCDAVDFRERGWDQGTMLQIALACAAAPLLGLNEEQTANAIALAACESPATRQVRAGRLSMWKGGAAPNGARNAVFLAQLAAAGMTGPDRAFDGRHGFFEQVSGGAFDLNLATYDAPSPAVTRALLKYLPIETNIQSAANAALELRSRVAVESIESVKISTFWRSYHETGSEPAKWAPESRETADHSMPFIVATMLRDGTISEASFAPARLTDASLRALMDRIAVEHDASATADYPQKMTTRITILERDGTRHEAVVNHPKGHPANPLTDDDVAEKFLRLTSGRLPSTKGQALLSWLWSLETHETIDPLFARAAGSAPC